MKYLLAFCLSLLIVICYGFVTSKPESSRTVGQIIKMCREEFKPGDDVRGMATWCYEDFAGRGVLTDDGSRVKAAL